jgi:hypothetical protein
LRLDDDLAFLSGVLGIPMRGGGSRSRKAARGGLKAFEEEEVREVVEVVMLAFEGAPVLEAGPAAGLATQ